MQVNTGNTAGVNKVLDTIPSLLWLSGKSKSFTFFNKSWLQYTGRSFDELTGDGWMVSIHEEDLAGFINLYNSSFDDKKEFQIKCRIRNSEGAYAWFLGNAAPHLCDDGVFMGYAGCFINIPTAEIPAQLEQKLAEQAMALKILHEKLAEKNLEQERNNAELESFTYIA